MGEHTVASFDEELGQVDRLIREMGDLAGSMVGAATRSLLVSDLALAQRVVSDDAVMDAVSPLFQYRKSPLSLAIAAPAVCRQYAHQLAGQFIGALQDIGLHAVGEFLEVLVRP